jgi:hypothetical protein
MTREAFIRKWLANPQKQYNEQCIDEMRDDLDKVIDYAQQQVKNLNIPAVMGELTCDSCGCHPNVIYTTSKGRFCERCKPAS